MKSSTRDIIKTVALCIVLLYVGTSLIIYSFRDSGDQNVTLNVVGIVNATNSSMVSIQMECIRFCGEDLAYSSNDKVKLCWEQCAGLGKIK
jgi:hypothetical protein